MNPVSNTNTQSSEPSKRILIFKLGAIGDCVMTLLGVHRALHQNPNLKVTWVVDPGFVPVIQSLSLPAAIHVIEVSWASFLGKNGLLNQLRTWMRLWVQLARSSLREQFDLVLVAYRARIYEWLLRPWVRTRLFKTFRRDLKPGEHHGEPIARMLHSDSESNWFLETKKIDLTFSQETKNKFDLKPKTVILAPGGAQNLLADDWLRRWPVESYSELARKLIAHGYQVVLVGGSSDAWVMPYFKDLNVHSLLGKTNLVELIWVMKQADCVVTHDSGPMHLAILSETPFLALFGPTESKEKLPAFLHSSTVIENSQTPCRPCYDGKQYAPCLTRACLARIQVEEVFRKLHLNQADQSALREL